MEPARFVGILEPRPPRRSVKDAIGIVMSVVAHGDAGERLAARVDDDATDLLIDGRQAEILQADRLARAKLHMLTRCVGIAGDLDLCVVCRTRDQIVECVCPVGFDLVHSRDRHAERSSALSRIIHVPEQTDRGHADRLAVFVKDTARERDQGLKRNLEISALAPAGASGISIVAPSECCSSMMSTIVSCAGAAQRPYIDLQRPSGRASC